MFSTIGDISHHTVKFVAMVKQFVYNEHPIDEGKATDEVAIFSAETRTLRFLQRFREFHDYTLMCGHPMAAVLLSPANICKKCHRQLVIFGSETSPDCDL